MDEAKSKMEKTLDALEKELATIRTGRANPNILDRVNADYYGTPTPVKNMANISNQDGRTLVVLPFDKGSLKDIEKAIIDSDLGLTPTNDGARLIITMPDLTSERRQELAKLVRKEGENSKVSIRNARRDALDKYKKDDTLTEDDKRGIQDDVQKLTDEFIKNIDDICSAKEKEITSI